MTSKPQIPGFPEIDEWPNSPEHPVSITDCGRYRDPRPHPTVFVELTDSAGKKYELFFDRFLWRLCFGATRDDKDGAMFVTTGSSLERDILEILDAAIASDEKYEELREPVRRAKHWSPNYS